MLDGRSSVAGHQRAAVGTDGLEETLGEQGTKQSDDHRAEGGGAAVDLGGRALAEDQRRPRRDRERHEAGEEPVGEMQRPDRAVERPAKKAGE
jgi:hypothetical protein